ncbi:hypothetical protein CLV92_103255 [Kineococcus xinjiangensis]|uniref:DUF2304 domain-containing protein n=1 Tax=Kineococcus xinjiangensis TaxID=512762 RepID=A0A2S6IU69_9ACTN|nr:DUF2304 domain-containing protein [Kineococcus xinjiangensis]PPK97720.1 hypothetical protein CLV92_103255 [Kineococcus xinjiangensis]
MLGIQVLLITAVLVTGALLVRSTAGDRHQAVRRLLLALLVVLAIASILAPAVVTAVARAVGVGRGTDLLLYCLVIAFLGFVVSSYRKSRLLEAQVTALVRRLALDEAVPPVAARSGPPRREDGGDGPGAARRA